MTGLDPIETASRDEIAALQRERLAWTLRHAYTNVAHYRAAFDRAGVHPDDFRQLEDLAKIPVHQQAGPARQLSVRHVRRAAREAGAAARFIGHDGKADRGWLYGEGHRDLGACCRAFDLRCGRPAGDDRACRVWLWAVHRWSRRALRCGTTGLHRGAGVRGHDRAAGAVDRRFPARRDHGDAKLHAGDIGRIPPAGTRSARRVR